MKCLFGLALVLALLLWIGQLTGIADGHTVFHGPLSDGSLDGSPASRILNGSTSALATMEPSEHDEPPLGEPSEAHSTESARQLVPAVVFPADRVRLRTAASGTIRELSVLVGETVSAGEVLCRIRSDEDLADLKRRDAEVATARCRVDEAQAELELAEYELALKGKLSRVNTVSKAEFDTSRLRVRSASARLEAARQELLMAKHGSEMIEKRLERYETVAPLEGRVTEILGHVDQYVKEGDTVLWIESHEKRLKVHLPAERVRGRDQLEVSILVHGEWRALGGGVPQPKDNPDGTVTVVFDLGRTDEFVAGQNLQVDAGSEGTVR